MPTAKPPPLTKAQRAYFAACGRLARGVKKTYTPEELAKRTARLKKTPSHKKHNRRQAKAKAKP